MSKIDSKFNIVIVDDEPLVTTTLKNLLLIESDYEPNTFNNPKEAVEFIKTNPADLVVSDFLMPEMNGIEFLSEVKKVNPGATLILLTGYADKESAIKAINEVGIYRYIEKPWDNQDLVLAIKNGIERSHLIESLENKVNELSIAHEKLEQYNEQLESVVKERTADLLQTNNKLSAIINNCADGIVTVTHEGKIAQANPVLARLCGIEEEDLVGKDFGQLFTSSTGKAICTNLNPEKEVLIRDYKIINQEKNKNIPVEISFAPIISAETDEQALYVGVIRDITLQYELERLRDDFVATLTHDLRTPLLAAIQTLQFFLDGSLGELEERQHNLLQTMFHSNQDMLGLVNALLEVYKYESGQLVLCKDDFNLLELLEQCTKEVASLFEKKQIGLKLSCDKDIDIYADKQELRRKTDSFVKPE